MQWLFFLESHGREKEAAVGLECRVADLAVTAYRTTRPTTMSNVLFLRAPSEPDRYESVFSDAGYRCSSVPVLETVLVNIETLTATVCAGPQQYAAVIITSGRASEAWCRVVDEQSSPESHSPWESTPFYVVGKSTASALKASRFAPIDIRGESSGTSEELAKFILADLDSLPSKQKPFLYLTGDKNRDTLPRILQSVGVTLSPLQVYQTQGSSKFPDDLKFALESPSHQGNELSLRVTTLRANFPGAESDIWWIVFFAPSAAEFVAPFLRNHFDFRSADTTTPPARHNARVASIGPTTSAFLQDTLNIVVDAVASKPSADNLLQVIGACDEAHGG
ncbi:Uroporphyrinogen-III synthase [Mycena sanguinolenta]|uniref:Uroporphyrinogen-III synthase n=1 Tax=Mycena sanguinolenta TaxID=230812 RepID=A0A8H6ZCP2_9AGAR|nr:Uroporphyrinogen-III synthase [Mycena sanguinolenta]